MSDRNERSDRLSARFDDEPSDEHPSENTGEETSSSGTGSREPAEEEWVRVQFRVPEEQRDLFNKLGYADVIRENPELADLRKRDLQNAAVQLLLDNPDLWAEKASELYK